MVTVDCAGVAAVTRVVLRVQGGQVYSDCTVAVGDADLDHVLDVSDNCATTSSIRVNDQYRVTFRWENGHAFEVAVEDYY